MYSAPIACSASPPALRVQLDLRKTRILHLRRGFAFLGYTIKRGQQALYLLKPTASGVVAMSSSLSASPQGSSRPGFSGQEWRIARIFEHNNFEAAQEELPSDMRAGRGCRGIILFGASDLKFGFFFQRDSKAVVRSVALVERGANIMIAPEIFLSYSTTDRQLVVDVQKLLEGRGITTFLDRDNLLVGLPWPQALEEGLRRVRGVAIFIGRELGGWQKREMWLTLDRQVLEEKRGRAFPVIPVLLPGADVTPGFLFANTWIDLRSGLDAAVTAEALDAFERALNSTQPAHAPARGDSICPYRGLQVSGRKTPPSFSGARPLRSNCSITS